MKQVYDKKEDGRQKAIIHFMLMEDDKVDPDYWEKRRLSSEKAKEKREQTKEETNAAEIYIV